LCLMLVSLEFLVAAPEPFLCINNFALCPSSLALHSLSALFFANVNKALFK
jgi:hypothetical protein